MMHWSSDVCSSDLALKGAVIVGDFLFSQYRLLLLAVVAAVLAGIWYLLQRTAFGCVVRAGIQQPDMVAALGIRLQPYMTAVVVLGVDRTSTRLNSSHSCASRMPSSA